MTRSLWCLFGLVIILSGCVSRYPDSDLGAPGAAERWGFTGKLGVQAGEDSANLAIEWQQAGDRFEIDLAGPLGVSVARIFGDMEGVTLRTRDGESLSADDPDELLMMALGYDIPVEPMQYWVRGLPAPWAPYTERTDGMRQLGWVITWDEWEDSRPTRMKFRVPRATLKLVIRRWQIES